MRSVRSSLVVVALAGILAACGSGNVSDSGDTSGGGTAPVASASAAPSQSSPAAINTNLPAPAALSGWQPGKLCTIVTSEVAAKVLGKPVETYEASPKDPGDIDKCDYSVMAKNEDGIEKTYVANVRIRPFDPTFAQRTRDEQRIGAETHGYDYEVIDFKVPGVDDAFYIRPMAFVTKGDKIVIVNNGATGRFQADKLVEFATLVAATVS